ncbi:MAG: PadR family transcriptional regulator [Deltaproteobacteria bacterium]|jgi:DNA-binding PadR family transcriptional regulator|nr:PadR family transcriptional regulator [Deltaproteobacteria bacterium]
MNRNRKKSIWPSTSKAGGKTLDKLVHPLILAWLASSSSYGYALKSELEKQESLFNGQPPDSRGIYRHLKEMEKFGYVQSSWHTEEASPPRRCFQLTKKGLGCLAKWRETLTNFSSQIGSLIALIEENLQPFHLSELKEPLEQIAAPPTPEGSSLNQGPKNKALFPKMKKSAKKNCGCKGPC